MAVTSKIYGSALLSIFNKEIDYLSDDIYAAVLTNAYTPNQDAHDYYDDVVANELVGTGYTANGLLLTGKTITYDTATNTVKLDCADLEWTGTSWTAARYIVFYDRTPGTNATRPLISYVDLGADATTSSQPVSYVISASGIASFTVA